MTNTPFSHLPKAACIVLLNDQSIVVCSRRHSKIYGLPGGKVDFGETTLQAAVRETAEETGIIIQPENLSLIYSGPSYEEKPFFVDTFITKIPSTTILKNMEDGIDVIWMNWLEFLQNNAFKEYNKLVYQSYLNQQVF